MKRLAFLLVAGLLCAPAAPADAPRPSPESQGFSSERLARIATVMQAEIDKNTLPGAVTLIARNGQIVHFEAHGFLDAAKTRPMIREAVFRAASMTKPFVCVATMMLVEQGRLKLSDPITDHLPEFKDMKVLVERTDASGKTTRVAVPALAQITVHDLLRHTSGLAGGSYTPYAEIRDAYDAAKLWEADSDGLIQRLAGIPLVWQPGTHWQYGLSTDVLGVLLERITGTRLDLLLDKMLFQPLAMKDTGFQVRPGQRARLADALDSDPSKGPGWRSVESDLGERYRSGGGGTVTTAHDYFRFTQMLIDGGVLDGTRLLSRKTVDLMLSDHIAGLDGTTEASTGAGYGFGLGFAVRRQDGGATIPGSIGDAMWSGSAGTTFTIDPKERLVGVLMAQAPSTRHHLRFLFKNFLYGALVE